MVSRSDAIESCGQKPPCTPMQTPSTPRISICNHKPHLTFNEALAQLQQAHLRELTLRCQHPQAEGDRLAGQQHDAIETPPPQPQPQRVDMSIPWNTEEVAKRWELMCWSLACTVDECVLNPKWIPKVYQPESEGTGTFSIGGHKITQIEAEGPLMNMNKMAAARRFSKWSSDRVGACMCVPLHPTGSRRLCWDIIGLMVCIYDVLLLPLLLASLVDIVVHPTISCAVYWTVDVGLSLFTGYITAEGMVEFRLRAISRRYMKSWFIADCFFVFTDWSLLALGEALDASRTVHILFQTLRSTRLVRIFKLAPHLQRQMGRITSQTVFTCCHVLGYLVVVVVLGHYTACAWCLTWSDTRFDENQNVATYKYFTALHWSMAHCFLGSMDIYPLNESERIFTIIVLVVSWVIFSLMVSLITNDALELRSMRAEGNKKQFQLLSFFARHKLPSELVCRVQSVVQQHKLFDTMPFNSMQTLELLPVPVQREIKNEWFKPVLRTHPFFRHYSDIQPAGFKLLCNFGITEERLLPCEEPQFSGVFPLEQMLFVEKGELQYHENAIDVPDHTIIGPGMWACEEALWSTTASLAGRMISGADGCVLLLVAFVEFKDVAFLHQSSLPVVQRYAREFVKAFQVACRDVNCRDVLFNDVQTICEILEKAKDNEFGGIVGELLLSRQTSPS